MNPPHNNHSEPVKKSTAVARASICERNKARYVKTRELGEPNDRRFHVAQRRCSRKAATAVGRRFFHRLSVKGGWLFLALVVLLYGITLIVDPTLAHQSLVSFVHTADQMLPALVLVFVLIFITTFALNPQSSRHYLGAHCGLKGWLIAIGSGILAAGPVYPWYAVLADLRRQGVRPALLATFLYSRAIKLPLLPLMIHYFGIGFTSLLCVYLIGLAIVNGLVMQRLENSGFIRDAREEMNP